MNELNIKGNQNDIDYVEIFSDGLALLKNEHASIETGSIVSNVSEMLKKDETVAYVSKKATIAMQSRMDSIIRKQQEDKLNWTEKNIHISKEKQRTLENERYLKVKKSGQVAGHVSAMGVQLLGGLLKKMDETAVKNKIIKLVTFASMDEGVIPSFNQFTISRMFDDLSISRKKRVKLLNKLPENIMAVQEVKLPNEYKKSVGYYLYEVLSNKGINEETIKAEHSIFFEKVGFEVDELDEFFENIRDGYKSYIQSVSSFMEMSNEVFNIIIKTASIDREMINSQAYRLASYDPYYDKRKKNLGIIKQGGSLAVTIAAMAYACPAGDAAIVTGYAVLQKLLGESKGLDNSFKQILEKNNKEDKFSSFRDKSKQLLNSTL